MKRRPIFSSSLFLEHSTFTLSKRSIRDFNELMQKDFETVVVRSQSVAGRHLRHH